MPGLSAEYGISNTSFGIIMTIIGIIYGLSRFLNGMIADRTNARIHMAVGLALCAVVNFAFGCGADICEWVTGYSSGSQFVNVLVLIFGVLLVVNNICQGSGFPPCSRLLTHWVPPTELATKMSIWNTSHSIGAGLLSIMCGYILMHLGTDMSGDASVVSAVANNLNADATAPQVMNAVRHFGAWRWCFWIPSAIAGAGVIFILLTLRDTPKSVGLPEPEGTHTTLDDNASLPAYKAYLREKVFRNPIIWILAVADLFVYIVRFAVLDWGPKFLQEARGLSPVEAGWTVASFEIFGIVGMLFAGWATDRFLKGQAQRTCLICMGFAAMFMAAFWLLPHQGNHIIMIIVLSLAGFCIYGPQALIGVVASNQATKRAASTAIGLIGVFSYASVLITGLGIGILVDTIGWDSVFLCMIGVAIIGMLIFVPLWKITGNGYVNEK